VRGIPLGGFIRNASFHHFGEFLACQNFETMITCGTDALSLQDVRKCDDMLRILRFLSDLLDKEKIASQEHGDKAQAPSSLHELHEKLIDLEKEMKVQKFLGSVFKALTQIRAHPERLYRYKVIHFWHRGHVGANSHLPSSHFAGPQQQRGLAHEAKE
jgi:hypothetical protein